MQSLTKSTVAAESLHEIARLHFNRPLRRIEELKDGLFNAAYALELDDGLRAVIKIAPPESVRLLRYEKDIVRAEVDVMRLVRAQANITAPEIYAYDPSRRLLPSEYFIMACLPGTPFNKLRESLPAEVQADIFRQAGQILRRMNDLSGPHFGLWSQPDYQRPTWREAFGLLMDALLQDGEAIAAQLPRSYATLRSELPKFYDALDEVTTPRLIHWDLWDGNIFVDERGQITGLIDFERALWADPLMEANFVFHVNERAFFEGYGRDPFDLPGSPIRRTLYNVYLYLIMIIECYYRRYETDGQEKWAREQLEGELQKLGM